MLLNAVFRVEIHCTLAFSMYMYYVAMTRSLTIFLCVPALFLGELSVISFQHSPLCPSVSTNGLLMRF